MQFHVNTTLPLQETASSNWLPHFPNPADFRFNYYQLLTNSQEGLAKRAKKARRRVAVIGAGCAGMTAARELHLRL